MTSPFATGHGTVLSADIAVADPELLRHFYARVLCTGTTPLWRAADLHNALGLPIIGIGARTEAHGALPVQWMPHVQVPSVQQSVDRASSLGGRVLTQGHTPAGDLAWAVLQDPAGATFGVVPLIPADAVPNLPDDAPPTGRIAWLDVTVPHADALRDFYGQVIGWSVQAIAMRDGEHEYADYCMLGPDGAAYAGVCHARGTNAALPPVWLIYLPVGDVEESVRRVAEEGGAVIKSSRKKDGSLAYAAIRDPAGASVALVPA